MEQDQFPRVLILIQPFNSNTGGGITLTNLFRGWPKDRIAVACRGYVINGNTQTDICNRYYQLGQKEQKWMFPFNLIRRKYYSGVLTFNNSDKRNIVVKKSKSRVNFTKNYIEPFLTYLGLSNVISNLFLSPEFCAWADDFDPDIIYAQAAGRSTNDFCAQVHKYLNRPMVFHMMDDWPELLKEQSIFGNYWHKKIDLEIKAMLSKCSLHLAISESMAREYKSRYDIDFLTFHNPIDLSFWEKGQRLNHDLPENPHILYAGRMGLGIEKSLKIMAEAVTQVNKKFHYNLKFLLQVSEKADWMDKYDCVEHKSFVPYQELPIHFGNANILYLPYDFSEKSLKYIKYSMPTKASEYMVSGTPILVFAPKETALAEYAISKKWAKVVTDPEVDQLARALKELLDQQKLRADLSLTAISLAQQKHDAQIVRNAFRSALINMAGVKEAIV